ncbi:MAG: hypothetical protein OEX11_05010 [Nitrosomonas sp.]|nr:hypothetical protein [Nitrosomonas sp.]
MDNLNCFFSSYSTPDDIVPVPDLLKGKDKRADTAARIAVLAASNMLQEKPNIDLTSLNVVVINREGCKSHINKVSNGIKNHQPAQGFFVRGGPQTLATYTALALDSHGAAFTFVGDKNILSDAITTAFYLANNIDNGATLITVVVKNHGPGYQANSALILGKSGHLEGVSSLEEKTLHNHLSQAFELDAN